MPVGVEESCEGFKNCNDRSQGSRSRLFICPYGPCQSTRAHRMAVASELARTNNDMLRLFMEVKAGWEASKSHRSQGKLPNKLIKSGTVWKRQG